ncbi:hypothetical protein HBH53_167650 [Parastagonospora nodorum]|nr:hypothetical protein HBH53_167650 [Parastagonospora nodorum]
MAGRDSDDDSDIEWALLKQLEWYKSKANMISSNSMLQTNVREGYGITTLEVVELVEDLISYDWLAYGAKVKIEDLSNTLTLTLSETAQRRSSSVVSNRSIASITDKFGVVLLTEPAILNDANVALVDAVYYSVVIDALTMTLIEDDDDLLGTVNSYIKLRRLGARCKTEAADSRYAKVSGGRTKKDKDLEDSDTGSDRLGKEAQLKKTRDEEELAKAKKEKEEKEAWERETYSSDIDSEDDSEDEEAMTAKDLAREQKERLKALLNAKTRDGLSARVGTAMEYCTLEEWTLAALTDAYILYFKELLSDNGGIFANAMGMGKTRAMVLAVLMGHVYFKNWTEVQNARAEGDAIEYNAVDDDDKLSIMMTGWGRAADAWKNEVVAMDLANSTWCDLSDLLALRFCFFSDSLSENMGRLMKEEAMEMRIDTTDAIFKALAAANKLVALRSYVLGGATKHRLAPLAARFVIVCGFGKVDKHVFRAYNTMSVTAQRTIIRKGGPYVEKRAILLPGYVTVWGRTVFDEFYNCKSEGIIMAKDILEKEGLDELEASRRVIFNRFEMQAIASYSALATLKAAQFKIYGSCKVKRFTLNSVKDLFTNLSKDYFLVREARAITKSSLKFQNLSNLCSEVEILGTLSRTWSIAAEDAAKAANILLPLKEVCAKILIGSYKLIVQAVTWLGLREKFGDESVLVMQGGMTQHEINLKLAKWRDLDGPWIMVALMAFAEAIILIEATHVVIMEPQDRQNTQD